MLADVAEQHGGTRGQRDDPGEREARSVTVPDKDVLRTVPHLEQWLIPGTIDASMPGVHFVQDTARFAVFSSAAVNLRELLIGLRGELDFEVGVHPLPRPLGSPLQPLPPVAGLFRTVSCVI